MTRASMEGDQAEVEESLLSSSSSLSRSTHRSTKITRRWGCTLIVMAILSFLLGLGWFSTSYDSLAIAPFRTSTAASACDGLEYILGPCREPDLDGFIMVTPTFKREKMLPKFLDQYANGDIHSLRRIILLWVDEDILPPKSLSESLNKYKIPIQIVRPANRSLNERFRLTGSNNGKDILASGGQRIDWLEGETNSIFSLDDDIFLHPEDVEQAYQAWYHFGGGRRRMVGFFEREEGINVTYALEPLPTYSIVLTKAAFYHKDWIKAYHSSDLTELRQFVDESRNCEDILMSFLYANHSQQAPIYFKADFKDEGLSHGISITPTHLKARTECIRKFANHFGNDTLVSTSIQMTRRAT